MLQSCCSHAAGRLATEMGWHGPLRWRWGGMVLCDGGGVARSHQCAPLPAELAAPW
eukprot:CAMPEP_0181201340 /NCGR_PEP_ID=MMETSP1096-20121128/18253_1 /TAXON_ID=156174 ORGANISM="Chrysochromulina ericina, Strain CCMP281" /NCGR_SAMPLE_ID=MMETSP1096 /ASSEMBLY_ACC=CAM_ASM_000453 /LENGTH=55 /DNA_ID=CAMNT_0023291773 /DNA_START=1 /DNA_END=165 /DNA_ORIENTATION=-